MLLRFRDRIQPCNLCQKRKVFEADDRVMMVFHYHFSHIPTLSHGSNSFSHSRRCSELRTPVSVDRCRPNGAVRLLVITGRLLAL